MISGRDFIVFSDDWGRHPFSCQHIMKHFLPTNRVLWVNTIGMRNPKFTAYDIQRSTEKILEWFNSSPKKVSILPCNLTVISPVMTPYQNLYLIRLLNRRSVITSVRKAMTALDMRNPFFLTTLPNAGDYAGNFNEAAIVYYCVDDFTQWPGIDKDFVAAMEENLLMKADFVCASSSELCEIKTRTIRPMLLPHGVEFDHFSAVTISNRFNYDNIPRPLVGFFGAISPWIDFDLLYKVACSRPEWSFVFIGPADVDITHLNALANVHFVGKIPYQKLPEYAASFDIAIIPFLVNELTVSVNPLKLMEYLACGHPVVSTRLPEVEKFRDIVYLADTAVEFEQMIDLALKENSDNARLLRLDLARSYSWEAVAESLSTEIERVVECK